MSSHYHEGGVSQNLGNHIGTKSSIRQSKLFRSYESGNAMKNLLGQESLSWNVNKKEGCYKGDVYDHMKDYSTNETVTSNNNNINQSNGNVYKKEDKESEIKPFERKITSKMQQPSSSHISKPTWWG